MHTIQAVADSFGEARSSSSPRGSGGRGGQFSGLGRLAPLREVGNEGGGGGEGRVKDGEGWAGVWEGRAARSHCASQV